MQTAFSLEWQDTSEPWGWASLGLFSKKADAELARIRFHEWEEADYNYVLPVDTRNFERYVAECQAERDRYVEEWNRDWGRGEGGLGLMTSADPNVMEMFPVPSLTQENAPYSNDYMDMRITEVEIF